MEFPLDPSAFTADMRTAPDGSVWFAEPEIGRLGRIGRDGVLNEVSVQVAFGPHHPQWVAVGPDGSAWFDINDGGYPASNGIARLRPDGRLTTYPVNAGLSITVDSHGTAWISGSTARITDSGLILIDSHTPFIAEQLAEASDGNMWFLNSACPVEEIGRFDVNGNTKRFDAAIVGDYAYPNSIVRAPDGAVWFATFDGQLIRLASETHVTVYRLPWPDAVVGSFVVLRGNHIVMLGQDELLDFVAVNGTRIAGAQAIPGPLPHVAKDAAEGAAYATALQAAGATAKIVLHTSWEGDHAALFWYSVNSKTLNIDPNFDPNSCHQGIFVYVVQDSGAWRKYDALASEEYTREVPMPGAVQFLMYKSGCLNLHQSPSLGSKVVACLPSTTRIKIDQLPVYAEGYMWWHIESGGWAVHQYLLCNNTMYTTPCG